MDLYRGAERLMRMDDRTWRRHASTWSVWTRVLTVLPFLVLAIWSRVWLGWAALVPILAALAWIWLNPRLFSEPARFDNWGAKGVLGERIWIEHRDALPRHHIRAGLWLTWASLPGAVLMIWGLVALWWEGAVLGGLLTVLPKMWFVDRMVWIFEDWRRMGRPVPGVRDDEL